MFFELFFCECLIISMLYVGTIHESRAFKCKKMQLKKDYKIYLLDDNMFNVNIFQQHLFNLGYTDTTVFCDPESCMEQLVPPPTIIFYDCGVNFLKGLEVLKNIKKYNPGIYLVFICGTEDVEMIIKSLKYGAFDYFVKGENDVKNMEIVLTKIHRVKELLKRDGGTWASKLRSINL